MEDRERALMRKYGESKTTRIMMATVPHVTSGLGLRKFQADGFLLTRVYVHCFSCNIFLKLAVTLTFLCEYLRVCEGILFFTDLTKFIRSLFCFVTRRGIESGLILCFRIFRARASSNIFIHRLLGVQVYVAYILK